MRIKLAAIGALAIAGPIHADWKITKSETWGQNPPQVSTSYYKTNLWRLDTGGQPGYCVADLSRKHYTLVNTAAREFSSSEMVSYRLSAGQPSLQTIVIDTETKDTSEERTFFGRKARHLVTVERRHTETPGESLSKISETVTDGRYIQSIDLPYEKSRVGTVHTLVASIGRGQSAIPIVKGTHHGPSVRGLPVYERRGDSLTEITEISDAPLDATVFQVPRGFRRVVRRPVDKELSWTDEVRFQWQTLEAWIGNLFT